MKVGAWEVLTRAGVRWLVVRGVVWGAVPDDVEIVPRRAETWPVTTWAEVAVRLDVHDETLRRRRAYGRRLGLDVGGRWRAPSFASRAELEAWWGALPIPPAGFRSS